MRQRMWRKVAAVAAGVIALAGSAQAQVPVPMPAPGQPAPVVVHQAPAAVAHAPAVVTGHGCSGCGTAAVAHAGGCDSGGCGKSKGAPGHGLFGRIGGGTTMPIGCSCFQAEKTFLFGSCNQFFNPKHNCGGGGLFGERCPINVPYAAMPCGPGNPCLPGFSYLNR